MPTHDRARRYLGIILDEAGQPVGTCFQLFVGIIATAWHVLDAVGAGVVGKSVRVRSLGGDELFDGTTVGIDPKHDVAVIEIKSPFEECVHGLSPTDELKLDVPVYATGIPHVSDDHSYECLTAKGSWAGATTRASTNLGRMISSDVMLGMSGAPVIDPTGFVVGVVSGRYNSADGWLRDTVWVARTEDLKDVLDSTAQHRGWRSKGKVTLHGHAQRIALSAFERPVSRALASPLSERPGLLLRADNDVVPFTGQETLMQSLHEWCETDSSIVSVRLLTGRGGSGKTRAAGELCSRIRRFSWLAGLLRSEVRGDLLAELIQLQIPRLLVLDYAEDRTGFVLDLIDRLGDSGALQVAKVRLLLLARSAGEWWYELKSGTPSSEMLLYKVEPEPIPNFGQSISDRIVAFFSAIEAFARELGAHEVKVQELDLHDVKYNAPLDIHMLALRWVLKSQGSPTSEMLSTIDYLLGHEKRYWRRIARRHGLRSNDTLLSQLTVSASLCSAHDKHEAADLFAAIRELEESKDKRLDWSRWAHEVYPDPSRYLGSLQPDRLAERLMVKVIAEVPDLLARIIENGSPDQVGRALPILLRMAKPPQPVVGANDPEAAELKQFRERVNSAIEQHIGKVQKIAIQSATQRYRAEIGRFMRDVELVDRSKLRLGSQERFEQSFVDLRVSDRTAAPARGEEFDLIQVLQDNSRVFLRGAAGSGKTTAVLHLAQKMVDSTVHDHIVPIYVSLRRYKSGPLPTVREIANLVPGLTEGIDTGWALSVFMSGHALLIVDGIDEVGADRRDEVRDWLVDLVQRHPEAKYIVTSRTSVDENWLDDGSFVPFDILPLSDAGLRQFVQRWFAAHSYGVHNPLEEERRVRDVLRAIGSRPDLHTIAQSPLLCDLMCTMYSNSGVLPATRVGILQQAIEVLVYRRDMARSIRPELEVHGGVQVLHLGRMALMALRRGRLWLSLPDARFAIETHNSYVGDANVSSSYVLSWLIERSSVLRQSKGGNSIDFVHRLFRDFLAAHYLASEFPSSSGWIGELIDHVEDADWFDAISMMMALARPQLKQQFFAALDRLARREPRRVGPLLEHVRREPGSPLSRGEFKFLDQITGDN